MQRATIDTPNDLPQRLTRLADELHRVGVLTDPAWRDTLHAVPRHLFIPPRAWIHHDGEIVEIDRDRDSQAWWDAVYSHDTPIITQFNDGAGPPDAGYHAESSSSCPAPKIQFQLLQALDLRDGMKVLEIGTGTGWNAALLAHRLGDTNVVTVEVDPDIAAQALRALAAAGHHPTVDRADGSHGYPLAAPYDRVIATCAVTQIPYAWITQTRPGGIIVTPWTLPVGTSGGLLRLTVNGDGTASGRFVGAVSFMQLRQQRRSGGGPLQAPKGPIHIENDERMFSNAGGGQRTSRLRYLRLVTIRTLCLDCSITGLRTFGGVRAMCDDARPLVAILAERIGTERRGDGKLTYKRVADQISALTGGRLEPSPSHVWSWVHGRHRPQAQYLPHLAAAIGIEEGDLAAALNRHWSEARRQHNPTIMRNGDPMADVDLQAVTCVRRRRFLEISSKAAGAAASASLAAPLDLSPVRLSRAAGSTGLGNSVLEGLEVAAEHFAANFWQYPLAELEVRLHGHLDEVTRYLETPKAALKDKTRLCWAGARLAAMHARATFQLGRHQGATLYYNAAFDLAGQVNDQALMTWILAEEACDAIYLRQFPMTTELASVGQEFGPLRGTSLLSLACPEACAAARLGDRRTAKAAIQGITRTIDGGDAPDEWSYYGSSAVYALRAVADASLWLGDAEKAERFAEASLAAIAAAKDPSRHAVNALHTRMVLAGARATLGGADEACAIAADVLAAENGARLYTIVAKCRELVGLLHRQHPGDKSVQQLQELADSVAR